MKRNAFTKSGSCPTSPHVLPSVVATIEVAQIWSAQPWLVVTHACVASTAARFESPLARACRTNGSRAVSVHVRPPSPEEKTPAWHGGEIGRASCRERGRIGGGGGTWNSTQ